MYFGFMKQHLAASYRKKCLIFPNPQYNNIIL